MLRGKVDLEVIRWVGSTEVYLGGCLQARYAVALCLLPCFLVQTLPDHEYESWYGNTHTASLGSRRIWEPM